MDGNLVKCLYLLTRMKMITWLKQNHVDKHDGMDDITWWNCNTWINLGYFDTSGMEKTWNWLKMNVMYHINETWWHGWNCVMSEMHIPQSCHLQLDESLLYYKFIWSMWFTSSYRVCKCFFFWRLCWHFFIYRQITKNWLQPTGNQEYPIYQNYGTQLKWGLICLGTLSVFQFLL